jgi:hypothetical protein
MISIVDVKDLQYVLRPTVYRPFLASAERPDASRRMLGEARPDRALNAEVEHVAEPSRR